MKKKAKTMTGADLRALREEAGMTQADLARRLRAAYRTVRYWEARGDDAVSGVVEAAVLHVLGCQEATR